MLEELKKRLQEPSTYEVEYRDIWFWLSGISRRRDIRVYSKQEADRIVADIESRKKWLTVRSTKYKIKDIVQF